MTVLSPQNGHTLVTNSSGEIDLNCYVVNVTAPTDVIGLDARMTALKNGGSVSAQ
jgi:hypothetical protein